MDPESHPLNTTRFDERAAARQREAMVERQLVPRGIRDPRVLGAMRKVPRHRFVDPEDAARAYEDGPLAIGYGQTISQPFVVAAMSQALALRGAERVLEVGTGCGYQTAVLAELALEVESIEIVPALADRARTILAELGYVRLHVHAGDGARGLPERAPFDAVLVAAAPRQVPPALLEQLAPGGRLVSPLGEEDQQLVLFERETIGITRRVLFPVRFVPLTGTGTEKAERRP
jgi:protein-L-isoaspartate(D-aspartate) O-methyltransferase